MSKFNWNSDEWITLLNNLKEYLNGSVLKINEEEVLNYDDILIESLKYSNKFKIVVNHRGNKSLLIDEVNLYQMTDIDFICKNICYLLLRYNHIYEIPLDIIKDTSTLEDLPTNIPYHEIERMGLFKKCQ